ncbi:nucleoid-associated protein YejK [Pseudomonas sp. HMSC75E02]|uniref:nucleoid-associated protein YejK n=1 Tax=Pseudomonas sp. HMSC75E02 TaxID=1608908 RepID=UPI0008A955DC|nr:nucleoid-associated protein YejK [Pseudomonas sp. HMSC75E02]OHS09324.1 nucleoid-associated protein YejK [Pseudomonas sp. HMSC75E02]
MPIRNAIIHHIDKKPDGNPALLHLGAQALAESQALENLHFDLATAYNAKPSKAWGVFHEESGAYPFSGWLAAYLDGAKDFAAFSKLTAEHMKHLMEESNLSVGGHLLITHYTQGMTDYLVVALLQLSESTSVNERLEVVTTRSFDLGHLQFTARINISEWRTNKASKQYVSFLRPKGGRKFTSYFNDCIGCTEGVDAPGETRTLLKAFSDFVEGEDLPEDQAREKTETLLDYAAAQAKIGAPITLDELSELMDDTAPKAFADFIRDKDYGLSPEIPPDKRTLNSFRRFTARTKGLSISFSPHLLGSKVEFDQARDTLLIHGLPEQLKSQLKKVAL